MGDFRNEKAKARDEWLESEEGLSCGRGITTGQYLQNRLEMAFLRGWEAHERSEEESTKRTQVDDARNKDDRTRKAL